MKKTKQISAGLLATLVATSGLGLAPQQAAAYTSDEKLDNRVIFQSFSLFQPYESNMYTELANKGKMLSDWGITDVWMPPAYRSFSMARYMEGYAIADRYDFGEFPQGPNNAIPTKYGKADELKAVVRAMHAKGVNVQMDLVPNQMLGLTQREMVYVQRTSSSGDLFKNPYTTRTASKTIAVPYLAYTKGGGEGQTKYGYIKEWNKNYLNGTSLQGQGLGRIMTDEAGKAYRYFGADHPNNYLPEWLIEAAKTQSLNVVDTYLAIDGWYEVSKDNWKPMLTQYTKDAGYLAYMKDQGYATKADILAESDNGKVAALTEAYVKSQANYGYGSEERSFQNDNSGIDTEDQLLFVDETGDPVQAFNRTMSGSDEFLVGVDIANSNPKVIKEQKHWMKWMLETYGFDGFRIDAASHYDTAILKAEAQLAREHFGARDHLSYIESYKNIQNDYMKAHNNEQLVMDSSLYFTLRGVLGKASSTKWLSDIAKYSTVNREGMGSTNPQANWSFVNNHDQEKNRVNQIILDTLGIKSNARYAPGTEKSLDQLYTKELEQQALSIYNKELSSPVKKYSMDNVVSQYAYLLTNKDTVPTVYYGDMYQTDASYMKKETPYFNEIANLLQVRKNYAYGKQRVTNYTSNTTQTAGKDLIASVRLGKDRKTGVATVIGKNAALDTTIQVDMGKVHANQVFKEASGVSKTKLVTDQNGVLTVPVKGIKTAEVNGYLGVFVPDAAKAPSVSVEQPDVYQGKSTTVKTKLNGTTSSSTSVSQTVADTKIATVDAKQRLLGKKTGKTTLTTKVSLQDGFVLYATTPIETKANAVVLKATSKTLRKGQTTTIGYTSATDTIKSVTYVSSNKKIATVSAKGTVQAINKGKTTIQITYTTAGNQTVNKVFTVTVK